MAQDSAADTRRLWLNRGRGAALAFGLAAVVASPGALWAENAAPQTATSPIALIQQQSFAPLVKQVLPAVVNISVVEKSGADQVADEPELMPMPDSPNSPFDQFLHRFFEEPGPGGQRHFFPQLPGSDGKRIALGSGFIVDPSGYVVTNNHVVGNAEKVQVILQDDSKYTAKIVGRDPKTDLAVLKIEPDQPLP